jgi:hypothetical protein
MSGGHGVPPGRGHTSDVGYSSGHVSITDPLQILKARGVTGAGEELLQALREGAIIAEGLVRYRNPDSLSRWKALNRAWWRHLDAPLDSNAVYFRPASTNPPTPFGVEQLKVPREAIDRLWPEVEGGTDAIHKEALQNGRSVGVKTRGIQEAVDHLWCDGIPNGLSAKERDTKIIKRIKDEGGSMPSTRTIQRVLAAMKSRP